MSSINGIGPRRALAQAFQKVSQELPGQANIRRGNAADTVSQKEARALENLAKSQLKASNAGARERAYQPPEQPVAKPPEQQIEPKPVEVYTRAGAKIDLAGGGEIFPLPPEREVEPVELAPEASIPSQGEIPTAIEAAEGAAKAEEAPKAVLGRLSITA